MKKLDYLMRLEAIETSLRKIEVSVLMIRSEDKESVALANKKVVEAIKHIKSLESNIWEATANVKRPAFKFESKMPKGAAVIKKDALVDRLDKMSEFLAVMSEDETNMVVIDAGKSVLSKQKSLTLLKKASTALDVASETISDMLK